MPTHITPPPRAGQTRPEAAEPARRASRFDERGIALQTVIIMVVLLAIAGAVAAVLLSRARDATGDLESRDVTGATIDTEAECESTKMGTKIGDWTKATPSTCIWTDNADSGADEVTHGQCLLAGGVYAENGGSPDTCTVSVP